MMFDTKESNACWEIECLLPISDAISLSDALDEHGFTSSCFENSDEQHIWHLRIFIETEEELILAQDVISTNAGNLGIKVEMKISKLDDIDWVSETQKRFKPFAVGKFFIHSSYYNDEEVPSDLISIEIDAKMAFGTGEHETTTGCLQAISELKENGFEPKNVLDMGCGSAILAIAAAKLWPNITIVAADIETASVEVSKENFQINNVNNKLVVVQSDGYAAREISKEAPYDLILCNILATPLIVLAGALKVHLADNGRAVLSGLLNVQRDDVMEAHNENGLELTKLYEVGTWDILVLKP